MLGIKKGVNKQGMSVVFSKTQWKKQSTFKFSDKELNKAESRQDGFIGYRAGIKCFIWKYIDEPTKLPILQ